MISYEIPYYQMLYYITLEYITLHYITPDHIVLYCNRLHRIILYCVKHKDMHTHPYPYLDVCSYIDSFTYMYINLLMYVHSCGHTAFCTYVHTYPCIHVICIYVHIHMYMHQHLFLHLYLHMHTHIPRALFWRASLEPHQQKLCAHARALTCDANADAEAATWTWICLGIPTHQMTHFHGPPRPPQAAPKPRCATGRASARWRGAGTRSWGPGGRASARTPWGRGCASLAHCGWGESATVGDLSCLWFLPQSACPGRQTSNPCASPCQNWHP